MEEQAAGQSRRGLRKGAFPARTGCSCQNGMTGRKTAVPCLSSRLLKAENALLPLRDELTIHPGPVGRNGAPTFPLHDPLRNRFFRLNWPAFEILSRWHLGEAETIAATVAAETTLCLAPDDVCMLATFLARSQLLKPVGPEDTMRLLRLARTARTSWLTWLLHHYLFFRWPLVHPDKLLTRNLAPGGIAGNENFPPCHPERPADWIVFGFPTVRSVRHDIH